MLEVLFVPFATPHTGWCRLTELRPRWAATHTGALPEVLPELVAMLAWALLADPERLWSMKVWE